MIAWFQYTVLRYKTSILLFLTLVSQGSNENFFNFSKVGILVLRVIFQIMGKPIDFFYPVASTLKRRMFIKRRKMSVFGSKQAKNLIEQQNELVMQDQFFRLVHFLYIFSNTLFELFLGSVSTSNAGDYAALMAATAALEATSTSNNSSKQNEQKQQQQNSADSESGLGNSPKSINLSRQNSTR